VAEQGEVAPSRLLAPQNRLRLADALTWAGFHDRARLLTYALRLVLGYRIADDGGAGASGPARVQAENLEILEDPGTVFYF